MDIKDLKGLEAVIKLCRKQHVEIIKIDNIEIVLGKVPDQPKKQYKAIAQESYNIGNIDENIKIPIESLDIPTDELTDDQKMFGSSDPSVWVDKQ